jgi:hypothetical protein
MRAQHEGGIRGDRIARVARMHGARVRVFLPRGGHFDAVTEEAFVAGNVIRHLGGETGTEDTG